MKTLIFKNDRFLNYSTEKIEKKLAKYQQVRLKNFDSKAFTHFCNALSINTTISTIAIFWQTIPIDKLTMLVDALKMNKTVKKLKINSCNIGDEGARIISDLMLNNNTIIKYCLRHNDIKDIAIKAIANAVSQSKTLISLNLSLNEISEAGIIELAESIKYCKSLQKVDIAYNNQTLSSQYAILMAITNHPSLAWIDIGYYKNDNLGKVVAAILKISKKICYINSIASYRLFASPDEEIESEIAKHTANNGFYTPLAAALVNKDYSCKILKNYQLADKDLLGEYLSANHGIVKIKAFCVVINLYIAQHWPEILGIFKSSEVFSGDIVFNMGIVLGDQSLHCLGKLMVNEDYGSCSIM